MEEAKLKYNEIRNAYIKNQLHIAIKNAHYEGKTVIDGITESLRGANIPLNPQGKNADPYDFVPQEHVQPNPVFSTGDPVLRNPCSYESVAEVLQQIQQRSGIGDSHRKWCVAGCDGLPYSLGSRLQEKQPILKNVLLVPGHGHIEINAVKALFKLLWEPLLQDLAKQCGFNSIRAQVCAKNCADHHKSFMLLDISTQACLNEILFVFFNFAKKEQQEPSLKNLYKYISHSKDRNFRFISDVLFNYLIALKIYRAGVRRNNATCIKAGKSQLMKLFFGFGMRNYQEIAIKDTKTRVLAPPEILEFLEKHESFSVSGNPSKGEWGDFILESVNSKIKRWLPPGIPKESHWKEVCRNADILQKIRDNVYKQSGLQEDKSKYIYHRDIQHAVFLYQTRLRQSGYLNNTGHTEEQHISVSGHVLDRDLIASERQLNDNIEKYLTHIASGAKAGMRISLTPVFTTLESREKFHAIENKTKANSTASIYKFRSISNIFYVIEYYWALFFKYWKPFIIANFKTIKNERLTQYRFVTERHHRYSRGRYLPSSREWRCGRGKYA